MADDEWRTGPGVEAESECMRRARRRASHPRRIGSKAASLQNSFCFALFVFLFFLFLFFVI